MSRLLLLLHSNRRLLDACPRGNNETKRPRPYVHGDGGRSGERWRRAEPQAHVAALWTPSYDPLGSCDHCILMVTVVVDAHTSICLFLSGDCDSH